MKALVWPLDDSFRDDCSTKDALLIIDEDWAAMYQKRSMWNRRSFKHLELCLKKEDWVSTDWLGPSSQLCLWAFLPNKIKNKQKGTFFKFQNMSADHCCIFSFYIDNVMSFWTQEFYNNIIGDNIISSLEHVIENI